MGGTGYNVGMTKKLQGKTALVTGASKGIGRAIAISLGSEGAAVVLTARSEDLLGQVADEVTAAGGEALVIAGDVGDEQAICAMVRQVEQKYAGLDILVNNAGVVHAGPLEKTETADWDRLMRINVRAPFIFCREALRLLKKAPRGYIVNISSVVGVKGYANQTLYTASKHALRGMSMALAEELRGENVRVHVVCPGGVATDLVRQVRPDINQDDLMAPAEIAELVLYLVTHQGNAVVDELHIRRASSGPWF